MSPLLPDSPHLNQIIRASVDGDRKAQERLFNIYAGKMMTVCRRYASCIQEAEDFLQEGFIRVFTFLHTYESTGSFDAWIRRVFVNTALKQLSKKKIEIDQNTDDHQNINSHDVDIVSQLSENEILALLDELPYGYKTVFNLFVIEGYSHKEIADSLGVEESTSRSQLVKARKMLQEKIIQLYKFAI